MGPIEECDIRLERGEKLLWAGRPARPVHDGGTGIAGPVILGSVGAVLILPTLRDGIGPLSLGVFLLTVSGCAYLALVGGRKASRKKRTLFYALTDRRLAIGWSGKTEVHRLTDLGDVELELGRGGIGQIALPTLRPPHHLVFLRAVPEAESVADLVTIAQIAATRSAA